MAATTLRRSASSMWRRTVRSADSGAGCVAWAGVLFRRQERCTWAAARRRAYYEFNFDAATGALAQAREFSRAVPIRQIQGTHSSEMWRFPGQPVSLCGGTCLKIRLPSSTVQSGAFDRSLEMRAPALSNSDSARMAKAFWYRVGLTRGVPATTPHSGKQLSMLRTGQHPTDMLWLNKPAPSGEGESDPV